MRAVRHGVGTFTAAERWQALVPPRPAIGDRAIVYAHQRAATSSSLTPGAPYYEFAPERLRVPIIAGDFAGQQTWANDAAEEALDDLVDGLLAGTSRLGCATDKVCLFGGSMGSPLVLNYAIDHAAKVAAVGCVLPIPDLENAHDLNINGSEAAIDAAYTNHAGYLAALATHSPVLRADALGATGIPVKLWYSTSDTYSDSADVLAYAADVGGTCTTQSMGAIGHTFNYTPLAEELAAFFAAYV